MNGPTSPVGHGLDAVHADLNTGLDGLRVEMQALRTGILSRLDRQLNLFIGYLLASIACRFIGR